MSIIIGLTGQTGAGKTTACELFARNGFGIINCDMVAREVCLVGSDCLKELVSEFSDVILNDDKSLNRAALGKIVFSNNASLEKLNSITHPHILNRVSQKILDLSKNHDIIIIDAPTLFESGADKLCDKILSILVQEKDSILRIVQRDGVDELTAKKRLASQHKKEFFIANSDFTVCNDGSREEFLAELESVVERLK